MANQTEKAKAFLGTHAHTIDEKGRLTLPAKWRDQMTDGVMITRGLDRCLFVFPKNKFDVVLERLVELPFEIADARNWVRYVAGNADEAEFDKQGRILISQNLRNFASLNGEVVVVGALDRIEVWNPEKYAEIDKSVETNANALAERFGQMIRQTKSEK